MKEGKVNIIFCIPFPLTTRDEKRYGVEFLSSKGYDVYFFDFTKISWLSKKGNRVKIPDEIERNNIFEIYNMESLTGALKRIKGKKLIFASSVSDVKTKKYYEMIDKLGIPIFLTNVGGDHPADFMKITKNFNVREITAMLGDKIPRVFASFENFWMYVQDKCFRKPAVRPRKIFINCQRAYESYSSLFGEIDDIMVPIHTFDYDAYVKARSKSTSNPENNTCVFLDENVGVNHKRLITGKTPSMRIDRDKYYAAMRHFFDHIEKKTGLKVVIAVSPRSEYGKNYDIFGFRPMIKHKTAELVAESSLVIAHGSTSINFAVLFKKPVIITVTDELLDPHKSIGNRITRAMAESVGTGRINIDNQDKVENINFSSLKINNQLYDEHVRNFISFNVRDERPYWEIVHEAVI